MIRLTILIVLFTISSIVKGQDGFTHIFARGGVVYKNAGQVSAGFDFASKFHNAYELSFSYYRATSAYENYLFGLNYKPVILRKKNTNLRFRFGGYIGTDLGGFVAAPNAGLEWIQSLSGQVDLFIANNNGYFFWAHNNQRWRATAEIGVRFPF